MRYKLQCKSCGATCWVRGSFDGDVNAVELDEKSEREWEGGNRSMEQSLYHPPCPHNDYDVIDEDCNDDPPGFEGGFSSNH